jgi:hypothetical protein
MWGQVAAKIEKRLKVSIGTSPDNLVIADVNNEKNPHFIDSAYFTGYILVRVKDFGGIAPNERNQSIKYFENKKRTFSIEFSGRFKHEYSAGDVMFGAEFEEKVNPPTGTWIAMKFANLIDPALLHDAYCDKPWVLSPLLCAMNIVNVIPADRPLINKASCIEFLNTLKLDKGDETAKTCISGPINSFDTPPQETQSLNPFSFDETVGLEENNELLFDGASCKSVQNRRQFFGKEQNRKLTAFKPNNIYNCEVIFVT